MNTPRPADEDRWAARFFSGQNLLSWESISSGSAPDGWAADIRRWIDLAARDDNLPLVLPCIRAPGQVIWYGVAWDQQTAIRLGQELLAAIGPSYSDFDGLPYQLDPSDPQEAVLAECFARPAYRLTPTLPSYVPRIRAVLELYLGALERRPRRVPPAARPVGSIRSDFDRALLANDADEAERCFDELCRTGRLSAENRVFLEVRLEAGLERWPQIAGNAALLRNLADLPLPPQVLIDTIEAIYHVYVEDFEGRGDVAGALKTFREQVAARHGRLFATRRGIERPLVLKTFLLYEVSRADPNPSICGEIRSLLAGCANEEFVAGLLALAPDRPVPSAPATAASDTERLADEAFEDDQYDRAFALYRQTAVSPKTLRRMLRCAREIGSAVAAGDVLEVVAGAAPEIVEALGTPARETVTHLRLLVAPAAAGMAPGQELGWLGWARWVAGGAASEQAERTVRDWGAVWGVDGLAGNQAAGEEFAQLIGNAEGVAASVFRGAFPLLFDAFFGGRENTHRGLKPVYAMLLTLLALEEGPSPDDLELARELAETLAACGTTNAEYREMVQDLEEMLGEALPASRLSWALDAAEVLAVNPAPDPESRLRFFLRVLEMTRLASHRLTAAHRAALKLLCQDFQMKMPAEVENGPRTGPESGTRDFAGTRLAIYTLTEPAGKRAAEVLREVCPGLDIDINSDEVCTDRLAALAKNSDIFVFAWRSSKHQAYYCVKQHRPANLPFLQPLGKGTASIVRAAMEHLN